jgi:hypothetical protein
MPHRRMTSTGTSCRRRTRSKGLHDAGGRALPEWSVDAALALIDAHEIASAVLSLSTPGVHLDPTARIDPVARAQARDVNELAARVAHDHPDRFAFFATLTLPDVDGALDPGGRAAIDRGSAAALFPRFADGAAPEDRS